MVEAVVHVPRDDLATGGDGLLAAERVVVEGGRGPRRGRGQQPVAVVGERRGRALDRLADDVGVVVVDVGVGARAVAGLDGLGEPVDGVVVAADDRVSGLGNAFVRFTRASVIWPPRSSPTAAKAMWWSRPRARTPAPRSNRSWHRCLWERPALWLHTNSTRAGRRPVRLSCPARRTPRGRHRPPRRPLPRMLLAGDHPAPDHRLLRSGRARPGASWPGARPAPRGACGRGRARRAVRRGGDAVMGTPSGRGSSRLVRE